MCIRCKYIYDSFEFQSVPLNPQKLVVQQVSRHSAAMALSYCLKQSNSMLYFMKFCFNTGEEDEDGYDINRLRKPDDVDTMGRYDPLLDKYGRRGNLPLNIVK